MTLTQVARALGCSRQNVEQTEKMALRKIRVALEEMFPELSEELKEGRGPRRASRKKVRGTAAESE